MLLCQKKNIHEVCFKSQYIIGPLKILLNLLAQKHA